MKWAPEISWSSKEGCMGDLRGQIQKDDGMEEEGSKVGGEDGRRLRNLAGAGAIKRACETRRRRLEEGWCAVAGERGEEGGRRGRPAVCDLLLRSP